MPRKKKVDGKKLIKAVNSGKPSKEIMDEFGIKTSAQLKALYLDALVDVGMAPGIISARTGRKPAERTSKQIKVNQRGSLIVPADLVSEMGFALGDEFKVRRTKAGISLKQG